MRPVFHSTLATFTRRILWSPTPNSIRALQVSLIGSSPSPYLIRPVPPVRVDHPAKDDNPLRARNIQDQSAFDNFMQEAELKRDPEGSQLLSRAYANCRGVYLFEQCLCYPLSYSMFYYQLFAHVFGDSAEAEFSGDYYWALMDDGLRKKKVQRLDTEQDVRREALDTLGEELVARHLSRSAFKALVLEYHDRFDVRGNVREWLTTEEQSPFSGL